MSKTVHNVVIDHADGLHKGVANGGPDNLNPFFFNSPLIFSDN